MVFNLEWVGSVIDWKVCIGCWVKQGDDVLMMNLVILFDVYLVVGCIELVDELWWDLFWVCSNNDLILLWFVWLLLKFFILLNWFGVLKKFQQGIDIKKGGLFFVVYGVCVMLLQYCVGDIGIFGWFDRLVEVGYMEIGFVEELGEFMVLFVELWFKQQLVCFEGNDEEGCNN